MFVSFPGRREGYCGDDRGEEGGHRHARGAARRVREGLIHTYVCICIYIYTL